MVVAGEEDKTSSTILWVQASVATLENIHHKSLTVSKNLIYYYSTTNNAWVKVFYTALNFIMKQVLVIPIKYAHWSWINVVIITKYTSIYVI